MLRETLKNVQGEFGYRLFTTLLFWILVGYGAFGDWLRIGAWHVSRFAGRLGPAR